MNPTMIEETFANVAGSPKKINCNELNSNDISASLSRREMERTYA